MSRSRVRLQRIGGRLVTGPGAFLLSGLVDVAVALWVLRRTRPG